MVCVLLIAGAVVNVGVAWYWAGTTAEPKGSPFRMAPPRSGFEMALFDMSWGGPPRYHIGLQADGEEREVGRAALSPGCRFAVEARGSSEVPDGDYESGAWTLGAGWPWVALRLCEQRGPAARGSMPWLAAGVAVSDARDGGWFRLTGGRAPVAPVFPGFIGNTLFYGAVLAAMLLLARLRRRRGWRRAMLWGGMVLVCVVLILTGVSLRFGIGYNWVRSDPPCCVFVAGAAVRWGWGSGWGDGDAPRGWHIYDSRRARFQALPDRTALFSGKLNVISLPLWIPLAPVAGFAGWLMWLDRRWRAPGHCPRCNYDLAGLAGGPCPECGGGR